MSEDPSDRTPFGVNLPGASAVATILGLTVSLQLAIEAAIFPDRIKVDDETKEARLESLTKQLLRETKSAPTEGISESDEARGMEAVMSIIKDITGRISKEI
jgi:hypothetical protein